MSMAKTSGYATIRVLDDCKREEDDVTDDDGMLLMLEMSRTDNKLRSHDRKTGQSKRLTSKKTIKPAKRPLYLEIRMERPQKWRQIVKSRRHGALSLRWCTNVRASRVWQIWKWYQGRDQIVKTYGTHGLDETATTRNARNRPYASLYYFACRP